MLQWKKATNLSGLLGGKVIVRSEDFVGEKNGEKLFLHATCTARSALVSTAVRAAIHDKLTLHVHGADS